MSSQHAADAAAHAANSSPPGDTSSHESSPPSTGTRSRKRSAPSSSSSSSASSPSSPEASPSASGDGWDGARGDRPSASKRARVDGASSSAAGVQSEEESASSSSPAADDVAQDGAQEDLDGDAQMVPVYGYQYAEPGSPAAGSAHDVTALPPARNASMVFVLITVKLEPEVQQHFKRLRTECARRGMHMSIASWEEEGPIPRQRLLSLLSATQYHGIYCTLNDGIDGEILRSEHADSLHVVSTMSVGYDHIDVEACKQREVLVGHTPGVLSETTADMVVALLLATARRLVEASMAVRTGEWADWSPMWMCGKDVFNSTVGIVGLGSIGVAVARRLRGFNCRILYTGPRRKPAQLEAELHAEYVPLETLLRQSDFVVPQCPLTPETNGLFDAQAFALMKRDAIFINTTRGSVCNQDDLYNALVNGTIAAAGLDVTSPEPLPADHPLLQLPNCVVLPHIGSASRQTRLRMSLMAIDNLVAGLCRGIGLSPSVRMPSPVSSATTGPLAPRARSARASSWTPPRGTFVPGTCKDQ